MILRNLRMPHLPKIKLDPGSRAARFILSLSKGRDDERKRETR